MQKWITRFLMSPIRRSSQASRSAPAPCLHFRSVWRYVCSPQKSTLWLKAILRHYLRAGMSNSVPGGPQDSASTSSLPHLLRSFSVNLKILISWVRFVWLGLELNPPGTEFDTSALGCVHMWHVCFDWNELWCACCDFVVHLCKCEHCYCASNKWTETAEKMGLGTLTNELWYSSIEIWPQHRPKAYNRSKNRKTQKSRDLIIKNIMVGFVL